MVPAVRAQDAPGIEDANPLRPADTTSPRATLRSFLTNAEVAIEAWRRGERSPANQRAYIRAIETLDFSATPDGRSWSVQTQRVLLLVEILARLDLPSEDQIPGSIEVADGGIARWTLPGSRITIARIEEGPRTGEFLFSAGTVARLDRLYRQVQDLAYQPGSMVGIYEEYLKSDRTVLARERELRNRLRPTDTSSPRSTLEGFMDSVNRAYALVMEADVALKATPPTMTREEALEIDTRANNLLRRAAATLDLSEVPSALRQDVAVESVLKLKEIIDRMHPPPLDTIPNTEMVAAARRGFSGSFAQGSAPLRWTLPNTEIDIVEVAEGDRQGSFLFSVGTLRNLGAYYEAVRDLPYRPVGAGVVDDGYLSPGLSPGFYDYYITTPGFLIPRAYFLSTWLDDLPDWLKRPYGEQTLWQWIFLVLTVSALVAAGYVFYRIFRRLAARLAPPLGQWLMAILPVLIAGVVVVVRDFLDQDLNLTGDTLSVIVALGRTIILIMMAWAVWNVFKALAETIIATPRVVEGGIDASLLRIIARLLGFVAGVWIVLSGLQALGADIVPLLAGLGVGGLAVALAVRPTLENLIGGLILYFDKPVRVGDFCSFGGQTGTVESIGLRSTAIRGLDRTLISVPNAKFADMEIVNWARCDRMLITATLGLRYETEDDQLRFVLVKIREMLHAHPKIDRETVRVRFAGYGASSLDLGVRIYALTRDWNEFHAIREDVFFRIKAIVTASGTGFAFPSQTLYLGRDDGLDENATDQAVAEVEGWREAGDLPFPRLRGRRMDELEGTLDYPPHGSAEAQAQARTAAEPLSTEPVEEDAEQKRVKEPANPDRQ